jgi:hypothetical protein
MRPVDLFWIFFPDELIPLLIVGLGMATIVGLIRPKRVLGILVLLLLTPGFSWAIENAIALLPWWVGVLIMVLLGLNVLRLVLELFVGKEAAGHIIGQAVTGTFRGLVRMVTTVIQAVATLVSGGFRWAARALRP